MRSGVLGALVAAALVAPAWADEPVRDPAVTAADVLRWHAAGATADQLLARVRVAPRVARSSVADLEALTRAEVPAELVVLLLRRGADASPAAPAPVSVGAEGTLRVRARGAFDLHVRVEPGDIAVLTADPGVEPAEGYRRIAAGAVERLVVAPGPYQLTVDTIAGPRLRVPSAGLSAVVVDAPGYYGYAEAVAAGRTDEDPPARAPTTRAERDQQETYAARWARVTPELVEGYQGGTAMLHAGWRTRRPGVPKWVAHQQRYPHDHDPVVIVTDGACRTVALRERDDAHVVGHDLGRTLLLTGPVRVAGDLWRQRTWRTVHRDRSGRLVTGQGRTRRPWVYRLHR